jgi:hypothetical protein
MFTLPSPRRKQQSMRTRKTMTKSFNVPGIKDLNWEQFEAALHYGLRKVYGDRVTIKKMGKDSTEFEIDLNSNGSTNG